VSTVGFGSHLEPENSPSLKYINPNNKAHKTNENAMQTRYANCLDDRLVAGVFFPDCPSESGN